MKKCIADDQQKEELTTLVTKYSVENKVIDNATVTLPRLALAFPELTWKIKTSLPSVNFVLMSADLGTVNLNFGLPYISSLVNLIDSDSSVTAEAKMTFLIMGCSALMTMKISGGKLLTHDHLHKAVQYPRISSSQSKVNKKIVSDFLMPFSTTAAVADLMFRLLKKSKCDAIWDEESTGFHAIMNEISKMKAENLEMKDVVAVIDEKNTFDEMKKAAITLAKANPRK